MSTPQPRARDGATLRIATWNLERPSLRGHTRNPRLLSRLLATDADLWVLTETNRAIALDGYAALASPSVAGYHRDGENFTTLWSRWPILQALPTFNPALAVCAEIASPAGPLIVFGTIITYANDPGPLKTARRGEEHRKSIDAHAADWQALRQRFPDHHFCVAGDFNQSRDGSGWYADAESVDKLSAALRQSALHCVTDTDMRAAGLLHSRASVDHICLSEPLAARVSHLGAWEGRDHDGLRMSDHNGVVIDIRSPV